MFFGGTNAGVNPIVTHGQKPFYNGKSDPSIGNPYGPPKANPYLNADPKKWDPSLTALNRPPINFSSKMIPDENSLSTWDYDISPANLESEARPMEKYSKEQLSTVFKEPRPDRSTVFLSHHTQPDHAEALVQPERGYRRARDPQDEIHARLNLYKNEDDTIKAIGFNARENLFNKKDPYDASVAVSSSHKDNKPDKTFVGRIPKAYLPPKMDDRKREESHAVTIKHMERSRNVITTLGVLGVMALSTLVTA
jgi:hypothetical protein